MNSALITSLVLSTATVFIHILGGDREARMLQPAPEADVKQKTIWTMLRGAFHWVTLDLLIIAVLQWIVLLSDVITAEKEVLFWLGLYCCAAAVFWVISVLISPRFEKKFLVLGQWILMLVIGGVLLLAAECF
ncbi:MAG: hypothetical protein ACRC3B_12205 [Bacteroidia bacterium]